MRTVQTLLRAFAAMARGDRASADRLLETLEVDDRTIRSQLAAEAEPVVRLLVEHLRGQITTMMQLAALADDEHRVEAGVILESAERRYAELCGQLPGSEK